jgi:hypothetical protein
VIEDHGLSYPQLRSGSLELEVVDMAKSLVVRLFWGSLIGLASGLLLMGVSGALATSNGIFIMNGPDVTGIRSGILSWTLLGLMGLALLVLLFSAVTQFVAWIGAVLNTAQLPNKTWFAVLLIVGLLGFAFVATLVYVIAGPDGLKVKEVATAVPQTGSAPPQVPAATVNGSAEHVGSFPGGYPDHFT